MQRYVQTSTSEGTRSLSHGSTPKHLTLGIPAEHHAHPHQETLQPATAANSENEDADVRTMTKIDLLEKQLADLKALLEMQAKLAAMQEAAAHASAASEARAGDAATSVTAVETLNTDAVASAGASAAGAAAASRHATPAKPVASSAPVAARPNIVDIMQEARTKQLRRVSHVVGAHKRGNNGHVSSQADGLTCILRSALDKRFQVTRAAAAAASSPQSQGSHDSDSASGFGSPNSHVGALGGARRVTFGGAATRRFANDGEDSTVAGENASIAASGGAAFAAARVSIGTRHRRKSGLSNDVTASIMSGSCGAASGAGSAKNSPIGKPPVAAASVAMAIPLPRASVPEERLAGGCSNAPSRRASTTEYAPPGAALSACVTAAAAAAAPGPTGPPAGLRAALLGQIRQTGGKPAQPTSGTAPTSAAAASAASNKENGALPAATAVAASKSSAGGPGGLLAAIKGFDRSALKKPNSDGETSTPAALGPRDAAANRLPVRTPGGDKTRSAAVAPPATPGTPVLSMADIGRVQLKRTGVRLLP